MRNDQGAGQDAPTNDDEVNAISATATHPAWLAALDYATRGLPVFPCKPRSKEPATEHGFKDATTDGGILQRRLLAAGADCNLAVATGSWGFVLEDDGPGARDWLRDMENRHGPLPSTWAVSTSPGRGHRYFRCKAPVPSIAKDQIALDVEVKGCGGYVVAPPSIHPDGHAYSFVIGPEQMEQPAAAPAWLVELLLSHQAQRSAASAPVVGEVIVDGQRNSTLVSIAGTMRRRGISERSILEALLVENTEKCRPPLDDDEVRTIAHSVMRYPAENDGKRLRNGNSPVATDPAGSLSEVGGDELARSAGSLANLPYLSFLGAIGYLVKGWSHLLAGSPRVGKTDLLVALVQEWLEAGLSVLYLTEEPRPIWEARLGGRPGDWSGLRVRFSLGADVEGLRTRARHGQEAVVIVDALRNLLQLKDEKDNSEIARAVNPWIADQRATEKTLVMVHHIRKGGGEHGEAIAGGHALLGTFDVAIEVLRDVNQQRNRRLVRTYARLIESREAIYERVETSPPTKTPSVGGRFELRGDPRALRLEDVAERLLLNVTGEWQSTKECHDTLGEPRPSLEQVRQALTSLADQGKLRRDPPIADGKVKGKTLRWSSPNEPNLQRSDIGVGGEAGGDLSPLGTRRCPDRHICKRPPDGSYECCGHPVEMDA